MSQAKASPRRKFRVVFVPPLCWDGLLPLAAAEDHPVREMADILRGKGLNSYLVTFIIDETATER